MLRRTTIEIDEELLSRAKRALGISTTRATVEEALRRAADAADGDAARRAAGHRDYFSQLGERSDLEVLAGSEMWR